MCTASKTAGRQGTEPARCPQPPASPQSAKLREEASKLFGRKDYPKALEAYEAALKATTEDTSNEDRALLHSNKAACYLMQQKCAACCPSPRRCPAVGRGGASGLPEQPAPAASEHAARRFKEAVHECSSALNLNPNYHRALVRRAKANEQLGLYKKALQDIQKANKTDTANPDTQARPASALLMGDLGEAPATLVPEYRPCQQAAASGAATCAGRPMRACCAGDGEAAEGHRARQQEGRERQQRPHPQGPGHAQRQQDYDHGARCTRAGGCVRAHAEAPPGCRQPGRGTRMAVQSQQQPSRHTGNTNGSPGLPAHLAAQQLTLPLDMGARQSGTRAPQAGSTCMQAKCMLEGETRMVPLMGQLTYAEVLDSVRDKFPGSPPFLLKYKDRRAHPACPGCELGRCWPGGAHAHPQAPGLAGLDAAGLWGPTGGAHGASRTIWPGLAQALKCCCR